MSTFIRQLPWFSEKRLDELSMEELREAFQANLAYTQKLEEILQKHGIDATDEESHQSSLVIRLQLSEWHRGLDREDLRRMMRSQVKGYIRTLLHFLTKQEPRLSDNQADWFRDFDMMLMLNN